MAEASELNSWQVWWQKFSLESQESDQRFYQNLNEIRISMGKRLSDFSPELALKFVRLPREIHKEEDVGEDLKRFALEIMSLDQVWSQLGLDEKISWLGVSTGLPPSIDYSIQTKEKMGPKSNSFTTSVKSSVVNSRQQVQGEFDQASIHVASETLGLQELKIPGASVEMMQNTIEASDFVADRSTRGVLDSSPGDRRHEGVEQSSTTHSEFCIGMSHFLKDRNRDVEESEAPEQVVVVTNSCEDAVEVVQGDKSNSTEKTGIREKMGDAHKVFDEMPNRDSWANLGVDIEFVDVIQTALDNSYWPKGKLVFDPGIERTSSSTSLVHVVFLSKDADLKVPKEEYEEFVYQSYFLNSKFLAGNNQFPVLNFGLMSGFDFRMNGSPVGLNSARWPFGNGGAYKLFVIMLDRGYSWGNVIFDPRGDRASVPIHWKLDGLSLVWDPGVLWIEQATSYMWCLCRHQLKSVPHVVLILLICELRQIKWSHNTLHSKLFLVTLTLIIHLRLLELGTLGGIGVSSVQDCSSLTLLADFFF